MMFICTSALHKGLARALQAGTEGFGAGRAGTEATHGLPSHARRFLWCMPLGCESELSQQAVTSRAGAPAGAHAQGASSA